MTIRQCILLFPDLTNREQIDRYRSRFDPLAGKIVPHVTLVFPFAAKGLEGEALADHVAERIRGMGAFELEAALPAVFEKGYVYLRIDAGGRQIQRLHDSLYTDGLRSFLRTDVDYIPHITIGRFADAITEREAREAAAVLSGPFRARIHEILIERIGADEESIVVSRLPLEAV